jgi:predicted transcriptional regulator
MSADIFAQDKKILELETRKKIFLVIRKFAGSHFREIQRKSGLAVGSVRHHLHALVKSGLVREIKQDGNLVYFPREFKSEDAVLLSLLRQESIRKILIYILTHDNCNHEQIVKAVNLSPSTVTWHLHKLHNIISSKKQGRKTFYSVSYDKNSIINLLVAYQESFVDKLVDRVIEMWSIE